MEQITSNCVNLDTACQVLAESRSVQALVKEAIESKDFLAVLAMMEAGKLEGDHAATVHDLLTDTIEAECTLVWSGTTRQPDGDYPVHVNEYRGVYWVWGLEYDPVGYFLGEDSAVSFALSNWDNVFEH